MQTMPTREAVGAAIVQARPLVERIAKDPEIRVHVLNAAESAQRLYGELSRKSASKTDAAKRIAIDSQLQDEIKNAIKELQKAGERAKGKKSHKARNTTLIVGGILIGILFNPATGADTRRWIKDKLLGAEEPFEYSPNGETSTAAAA